MLGRQTLQEYAERWRLGQQWKPTTAEAVETILRCRIYPTFGHRPLNSILHSDIQSWVGELSKKYAPRTVQSTLVQLGSIFNAAYGDYSTMPTAASRGTPTVAVLTGTKGTTLKCEFYNNDYTNNGFGACKSLTGALYKLSY